MANFVKYFIIAAVGTHLGTQAHAGVSLTPAIQAQSAQDQAFDSKIGGFSLRGESSLDLIPERGRLQLIVDAEFRAEQGSSKDFNVDAYQPKNELKIDEALVRAVLIKDTALSAGIISQESIGHPGLMGRHGFPGIEERAKVVFQPFEVSLRAEQTIPQENMSGSASVKESSETPTFFNEEVLLTTHLTSQIDWTLGVMHYRFQNLSAGAAQKSRFLGNRVSGSNPASSTFGTFFEGWGMRSGFQVWFDASFILEMNGSWFTNTYANPQENSGMSGKAVLHWLPSGPAEEGLRVSPSLEAFQIQSNATPAVFAQKRWGFTNREGVGVGLAIEWKKFFAEAEFIQSRAIEITPYQYELNGFWFQVGKTYEVL